MKLLCIDGGGIRGIFAITILQALEEEVGHPVGEIFDVVSGTSTGAIIAASVSLNKNMSEIYESYKHFGGKIFTRQAKVGLFKSVYSDRSLRHLLKKAFGEVTLQDITKPLLIPAVDITHGKPFIHRSNYGHPDNEDLSIKLWDAVLSSCSAPVYFPPNKIGDQYLSIDGGLWANNPSLVGMTEAIHFFNKTMNEINILSIGTGLQNIDFTNDKEKYWGINQWLPFHFPSMKVTPKLLDLALHLSSESVSYHCQLLLKDHYLRINEELGEEVPFDEVKYMDVLSELGRSVFKKQKKDILSFIEK
ncbi:CBASS cGAMP-activated phospholipase [Neobacillus niacini]|uniref:CBASS cGAMP-activated phospholipase n=1 Tax=Neobacillus niacini TaxID=86668 RepID=UPI001C8DAAF4|nr:CBASS cGAMP-activated phospholipase [Neobacillus niacini]MBY0147958.1 patatin-like phospholipase family protein [Neobacillus niacini]